MTLRERKYEWDSRALNNFFMIQLKAKDVQTISAEFDKYVQNESLIQGSGLR